MSSTAKRGPPHDPNLLIRQVIEMGAEFTGPAEDILFSWLISLAADLEPATAANLLLDEHNLRHGEPPPGALGRLWTLLRETSAFPDSRLSSTARGKSRRRTRN